MELPRLVSKNPEADALWRNQYKALLNGQVFDECLEDQYLQCLYYYPMTLILGRAFEQMGRAGRETDVRRLFILVGRMIPYLGVRWQQSSKARGEAEDPSSAIVLYDQEGVN
jgi:hypothetical protein